MGKRVLGMLSCAGQRLPKGSGHPWGKTNCPPPPPLLLLPVPQVFGKVAEEKKGKVQVFFCGSPALAKVIRTHCERFGFRFFKENF